jgi:hypothetical protein
MSHGNRPGLAEERRTALAVVLAIVFWCFSVSLFMPQFVYAYNPYSDINFYYLGENPEGGALAYPVGALAYFSLARAFSPDGYVFSYIIQAISLAFFLIVFWVFSKMHRAERLVEISIIFSFLIYLVVLRIEIVAIALALLGVYLFQKGNRMAGWVLVIFSAFVKIFPAFLLPLFFIIEMRDGKKNAWRVAMAAVLGLLLFFGSDATLNSLAYQAKRGIEIESIYANVLFIINAFNPLGISIEYSTGSMNIVLPETLAFLAFAASALQIIAVIAMVALFWLDTKRGERLWEYSFLVMAAGVFAAKISSTQFMLWPLVFAVPLMWNGKYKMLYPACVALSIFTMAVFPFGWGALIAMEPAAIAVLTVKNLILAGMIAYVARGLSGKEGTEKAKYVRKANL